MLKILLPTDFSPLALQAAQYAIQLAKVIPASFTLLHVNPVTQLEHDLLDEFEKLVAAQVSAQLDNEVDRIRQLTGYTGPIATAHTIGNPVTAIGHFANAHDIDLIIMGTKGETAISRSLFGSVASGVMEQVSCPSLFVPMQASIKPPNSVAFATDLTDLEAELPELIAFARLFSATIHVLHVYPDAIDAESFAPERDQLSIYAKKHYPNITFNAVLDADIISGIDRFTKSDSPDMLAMFTYKSGMLSYLFDTGYTEEMVFHAHVPLLVMRKN